MIVLDRSGSMNLGNFSDPEIRANWTAESSYDFNTGVGDKYKAGPDCLGIRTGDVDICGDGYCSGKEHFWKKTEGFYKCKADCAPEFKGWQWWSNIECGFQHYASFMARNKQMFRNILPKIREYVRFAVVSHHQDGYYRYFQGDPALPTEKRTVFFSKWELKNYSGWDETDEKPKTRFTWTEAKQDYAINSDSSAGLGIPQDSLYARADDTLIEKRFPWGGESIQADGHRWVYQGTYYTFEHYRPKIVNGEHKLEFVHGKGEIYAINTLIAEGAFNSTTGSATLIKRTKQILGVNKLVWHWTTGVLPPLIDGPHLSPTDKLFAVETLDGWDSSPKNIFYEDVTQPENRWLTSWCGMTCTGTGADGSIVGRQYKAVAVQYQYLREWYEESYHSEMFDKSLGQQFTDGSGDSWYLRPVEADSESNTPHYDKYGYGFPTSCTGDAPVLVPFNPDTSQVEQDKTLGDIMALANKMAFGGMAAGGETPLGPAMAKAADHFTERMNGTGHFSSAGPDPYAACRPRFVIMITDSSWSCANSTADMIAAHAASMRTGAFASNPVKTYVLLTPGSYYDLPGANRIAAAGGTGTAVQVQNTSEFVDEFERIIFEGIRGSFTTSAPISVTSPGSRTPNNLSMVTTIEVPEFDGNIHAYDHRVSNDKSNHRVWEAKSLLAARDWKERKLYIGAASINGGVPSTLIASDGSGELNITSCGTCGGTSVAEMWTQLYSESPPEDLAGFIAFLVSEDESPSFGPFIHSAPVLIGEPPRMDALPDHSTYENSYAARKPLIYATSDSGFIHAIDAANGQEEFAFFPAVYLKDAYNAYQGENDRSLFEHQFVQANPLRVYDSLVTGGSTWSTKLFSTQGAGGKQFMELDITNPEATPPVKVTTDSHSMNAFSSILGESWSVPSIAYKDDDSKGLQTVSTMGSGYDHAEKGYSLSMSSIGLSSGASNSSVWGSSKYVPYGVTANNVMVVDETDKLSPIASYQATLSGRIRRYKKGMANAAAYDVVKVGSKKPFYFPPTVVLREDKSEIISAVSGSYYEDASWMTGDNPGFTSEIFMKSYNTTGTSIDKNCKASELCSGCGFAGTSGADFTCTAPGKTALPVSQPLTVYNNVLDETDVFFLYYEPPINKCGLGDSTFIALRISKSGAISVRNTKVFEGEFISGMSIIGQNKDIALARTVLDRGSTQGLPSVMSISGDKLVDTPGTATGGAGAGDNTVVERWVEVR